jgi:glutamate 5-kinase
VSAHREAIRSARSIVVKIGTTALTNPAGLFDATRLADLADAIEKRMKAGTDVVIVSSGAIAAGIEPLGLSRRPTDLATKQAAASVGQVALVNAWSTAFGRYDRTVGQVLLTAHDISQRVQHTNAQRTLDRLRALRAVAIVNENDTVATNEIRFGDNDRLAARVAQMVSADTLVLLSDIDGLYTADPRKRADAARIPIVTEVTAEIEAMGGEAPTGYSSGGMVTKLIAAKIALAAGCRMAITFGKKSNPLRALDEGAPATWFLPSATPLSARKRWIAAHVTTAGSVEIDAGAVAALGRGKSLLPAGVTRIEGSFERGDLIRVVAPDGREIARGLSAYGAGEMERIRGRRSAEIAAVLGYRGRDEIIHRDDLVMSP